jgi:hypothetical protein
MAVKLPRAFWPLTITAGANDTIDVHCSFPSSLDWTVTIAPGTYYSPTTFLAAVQAALATIVVGDDGPGFTVTFSTSTGIVTITAATGTFSLKFSTGTNAAISPRDLLGFGTVDTTTGSSASGTLQHQHGWYSTLGPVSDTGDLPQFKRALARSISGRGKLLTFGETYLRKIAFEFLDPWKIYIAEEPNGSLTTSQAFERLVLDGAARFRWWTDQTAPSDYQDYYLDEGTMKDLPWNRLAPGVPLYSLDLGFCRYV